MLKVDDIKSLVFGYLRSNSRAIEVLKNVFGIMSHAPLDIVKIFHQRKIQNHVAMNELDLYVNREFLRHYRMN